MPETVKKSLAQKLVEVYRKIDHIEKRGKNAAQNYNYVKASDLAHAIRNALAELNIYAQVVFASNPPYTYTTAKGTVMNMVDARCDITFIDADDPGAPLFRASGLGSGSDTGDKASYKAQTGAMKYALRNAFLVPDDTDPENDEAEPAPAPRARTPQAAVKPPKAEFPTAAQPSREPVTLTAGSSDALPTEEELKALRNNFKLLGDDLAKAGLAASKGLPIQRKVLAYLLKVTGASEASALTKSQWNMFFETVRVVRANSTEELVKLVNEANGGAN